MNEEQLRRYQNNQLKRIVRYAYTVPMYRDLYQKAGVRSSDIQTRGDLKKLPFVSKEDFTRYYPDGIISSKTNRKNLIKISTSATSGKSLSLFASMDDILLWFFIYIRILREYNLSWRKNRLSIIADLAPHTIGSGFINNGLFTYVKRETFTNIQFSNTNDPPETILDEVNKFNPEFLGGYPGMLGHLALLKEKGLGDHLNPKIIATIGSVLDPSLKKLIEDTFDAPVFEVYGATESGTLAFQCHKGRFHIMSDLVLLEFIKDGAPVASGEPGSLIVTRLYGQGTPIIRYQSINDIVAPSYDSCSCQMAGGLIDTIYGRDDLSLIFPGGKALLPSSFSEIYSRVLYQLKTNKVLETKVIQQDNETVDIYIVLNKKQKESKPSFDQIAKVIREGFEQKVGPQVKIAIKEVASIDTNEPRIISKVNKKNVKITRYL
jgi:phenylacetate-CoA ligase